MAKDAYYFSHDSNARHDPKILAMRSVYGMEGYGWYWVIVEILREQGNHKLETGGKYFYRTLAEELKTNEEKAKEFISDCTYEFHLFCQENNYLWSDSLNRRMEKRNEKSQKSSNSSSFKWGGEEKRLENACETPAQIRSKRLSEARKKGKHTKSEWEEMKEFFHNTCVRCRGTSGVKGLVKDHVIPIYQGGSDAIKNIQPLCAMCNSSKGPENIDHRFIYCSENGIELPTKWVDETKERLRNASETPALKENKEKESKGNGKETKDSTFFTFTSNTDLIEALKSFVEFRKKIKKPMTERAVTLLLKELDKLSTIDEVKIAILEQSILNGWQSVYALKDKGGNASAVAGRDNKNLNSGIDFGF
jgi:5-methylcytosine-specific restriction endonuclease McrA